MCFLRLLYCCCCQQQQDSQRVPLPDVQLQQLSGSECRLRQAQGHSLQAMPQRRITNSTLGDEEHYDADEHDEERLPTMWKAWWLQGAIINEEILRYPSSIVA